MWRTVKILVIAMAAAQAGCAEWAQEQIRPGTGPAPEEVLAAARAGDARAAFLAYRQATTSAERRKWICIAANRDFPEAQAEIARLHWHSFWEQPSPFGHDGSKAYIWSIIAVQRRLPLEDMERQLRQVIVGVERWRATTLALAWRPDPAQCEDMENSDYFSIAPVAGAGPAPPEVLAVAEAGDARAAFIAYRLAMADADRRKWLCIAANRDLAEAQAEIAWLHRAPTSKPPGLFVHDDYKAFVWSIIAVHRRLPLEEMERQLGGMVTGIERWRAVALAVSWKPDPSQCENMAESPYFHIAAATGTKESF